MARVQNLCVPDTSTRVSSSSGRLNVDFFTEKHGATMHSWAYETKKRTKVPVPDHTPANFPTNKALHELEH